MVGSEVFLRAPFSKFWVVLRRFSQTRHFDFFLLFFVHRTRNYAQNNSAETNLLLSKTVFFLPQFHHRHISFAGGNAGMGSSPQPQTLTKHYWARVGPCNSRPLAYLLACKVSISHKYSFGLQSQLNVRNTLFQTCKVHQNYGCACSATDQQCYHLALILSLRSTAVGGMRGWQQFEEKHRRRSGDIRQRSVHQVGPINPRWRTFRSDTAVVTRHLAI